MHATWRSAWVWLLLHKQARISSLLSALGQRYHSRARPAMRPVGDQPTYTIPGIEHS